MTLAAWIVIAVFVVIVAVLAAGLAATRRRCRADAARERARAAHPANGVDARL